MNLNPGTARGYWKQQDPDLWFSPTEGESTSPNHQPSPVAECKQTGDPSHSDLLPGESRGYWKHHAPGKWFRQAKITGKINNEKAVLLLDTGAEVSIVDTKFAQRMGCYVDRCQSQDCVGIGDTVYSTAGRMRIKITLAGYLDNLFDIWVGDLSGQEAILGMDFMVPAGIRLDLADGSLCLPDEVRIQLSGRRQLYNVKARIVRLDQHLQIDVGDSMEVPLRRQTSDQDALWVTRGSRWVQTVSRGPGKALYLTITNVGEKKLILQGDERIAMWLAGDRVPRLQGFVTAGSRRYLEWQNLALQATTDAKVSEKYQRPERPDLPAVERLAYPTPRTILRKPSQGGDLSPGAQRLVLPVQMTTDVQDPEPGSDDSTPTSQSEDLEAAPSPDRDEQAEEKAAEEPGSRDTTEEICTASEDREEVEKPAPEVAPSDPTHGEPVAEVTVPTEDEQMCYHEGGDLRAEEVEMEMAVLPEVIQSTEDVMLEDIQVGDPTVNTAEEIDRVRRLIWKRRHLLIGKGNALPPPRREGNHLRHRCGRR
ncbi:hypothetical protein PF003_g24556 [Phytophthora fragariae]|nr:hypothetical protein PF003_g24556 [Phytophthora fragariae]